MKRRFSKILGVGLTLALLCSLLLTAAPVSAVTTPVVTLTAGDTAGTAQPAGVISKLNVYTVLFTTGTAVPVASEIVVGFLAGTDIDAISTGEVQIHSSTGIGGFAYQGTENPVIAVTGTYPAAQTLTITIPAAGLIGAGAIVQLTIGLIDTLGCVTNPNTAGTYNLTVATQTGATPAVAIEAAVTSAAYTIKVPTIAGLPGVASVYNPTGILMAQENDLVAAIAAAGVDYTIYVGPGTYALGASETLDITYDGLTLVSTAGALTTIIDAGTATGTAIEIAVAATGVTVDGFTITDDNGGTGIWIRGDDAIIQNNVVTFDDFFATGIDVSSEATGVTVSGNTLNEDAAIILHGSDCTVSGNIFGHIMNFWALGLLEDVTITDNNFLANEDANFGILLRGDTAATTIDDTLIEGNIINGRANGGILIGADSAGVLTVTNLTITGNDITNHGDDTGDLNDCGIRIWLATAWGAGNVIKFNTITGNEDYGIISEMTVAGDAIDAALNWWGTAVAADIALMVSGTTNSPIDTTPFLTGIVDTVFSATAAGDGLSLDASTTVGVDVSAATAADAISVAKYITNPQAALADAIAFYDVYVVGTTATTDLVTIKFYAGDALTDVYLWSAGTLSWSEVAGAEFSAYGGYVYVTVTAAVLDGTPFALVAGTGEAITAPTSLVPTSGAKDVDLKPTLAWGTVDDAIGYDFELADNANFVVPLVKLDGELGRLIVTFYQQVAELDYSTYYYWRVKAVSADGESPWSAAVFYTVAEPIPEAPVWMCSEGLTFDSRAALEAHLATAEAHKPVEPPEIIVEVPDVIVPLPAETPITPAWIYVIIGVGAVLVIGLIVLIVRTRRVA